MAPEQVAASFCERDGHGERLRPGGWPAIAPLVEWELEPAWDEVVLITGYEVGGLRRGEQGLEVQVQYSVVARVTGQGVREVSEVEPAILRLVEAGAAGGGEPWRIAGPPPPPHVFANLVDADSMAASLAPESAQYLSNSAFVWQHLREQGVAVAYRQAAGWLAEGDFLGVSEPRLGDVVAYLHGGKPYHLGVYEGEDRVLSATINRGKARSRLNAFAGEIRYLRANPSKATAIPSPPPTAEPTAGVPTPEVQAAPEPALVCTQPAGGAKVCMPAGAAAIGGAQEPSGGETPGGSARSWKGERRRPAAGNGGRR